MVLKKLGPDRLALVMVGLPARGKTYVARKLQRYVSWLGFATRFVNVGDYRRARAGARQPADYFAPSNPASRDERHGFAMAALDDLMDWFRRGGEIGIYDAANTERGRRDIIYERCRREGVQVMFVESLCDDPSTIERNIRQNKLLSPDYLGMAAEEAVEDFRRRIAHYASTYDPVNEADRSYVKLVDAGRQIIANNIEGYLGARLVFFLMHIYPAQRPIWLTRHGESSFNVRGRIGGDSPLTERGRAYARALARFVRQGAGDGRPVAVWTSTLKRTIETAAALPWEPVSWRLLNEIDAGICDGMTYQEILEHMPDEYAARAANKFLYRYPRGESYADVIQRLEPLIVELERQRAPVLVIGHQAVLRVLYGYLMGKPQEECPHLEVPLHTVIQLTPTEAGYDERRFRLLDAPASSDEPSGSRIA